MADTFVMVVEEKAAFITPWLLDPPDAVAVMLFMIDEEEMFRTPMLAIVPPDAVTVTLVIFGDVEVLWIAIV